jgi:hypothetical protein
LNPRGSAQWHDQRMKLQKLIGLAISASGLAIVFTGIIY